MPEVYIDGVSAQTLQYQAEKKNKSQGNVQLFPPSPSSDTIIIGDDTDIRMAIRASKRFRKQSVEDVATQREKLRREMINTFQEQLGPMGALYKVKDVKFVRPNTPAKIPDAFLGGDAKNIDVVGVTYDPKLGRTVVTVYGKYDLSKEQALAKFEDVAKKEGLVLEDVTKQGNVWLGKFRGKFEGEGETIVKSIEIDKDTALQEFQKLASEKGGTLESINQANGKWVGIISVGENKYKVELPTKYLPSKSEMPELAKEWEEEYGIKVEGYELTDEGWKVKYKYVGTTEATAELPTEYTAPTVQTFTNPELVLPVIEPRVSPQKIREKLEQFVMRSEEKTSPNYTEEEFEGYDKYYEGLYAIDKQLRGKEDVSHLTTDRWVSFEKSEPILDVPELAHKAKEGVVSVYSEAKNVAKEAWEGFYGFLERHETPIGKSFESWYQSKLKQEDPMVVMYQHMTSEINPAIEEPNISEYHSRLAKAMAYVGKGIGTASKVGIAYGVGGYLGEFLPLPSPASRIGKGVAWLSRHKNVAKGLELVGWGSVAIGGGIEAMNMRAKEYPLPQIALEVGGDIATFYGFTKGFEVGLEKNIAKTTAKLVEQKRLEMFDRNSVIWGPSDETVRKFPEVTLAPRGRKVWVEQPGSLMLTDQGITITTDFGPKLRTIAPPGASRIVKVRRGVWWVTESPMPNYYQNFVLGRTLEGKGVVRVKGVPMDMAKVADMLKPYKQYGMRMGGAHTPWWKTGNAPYPGYIKDEIFIDLARFARIEKYVKELSKQSKTVGMVKTLKGSTKGGAMVANTGKGMSALVLTDVVEVGSQATTTIPKTIAKARLAKDLIAFEQSVKESYPVMRQLSNLAKFTGVIWALKQRRAYSQHSAFRMVPLNTEYQLLKPDIRVTQLESEVYMLKPRTEIALRWNQKILETVKPKFDISFRVEPTIEELEAQTQIVKPSTTTSFKLELTTKPKTVLSLIYLSRLKPPSTRVGRVVKPPKPVKLPRGGDGASGVSHKYTLWGKWAKKLGDFKFTVKGIEKRMKLLDKGFRGFKL